MMPVLFALAIVAILLIVVVAGQPDVFMVARTAQFAAPPEKIFSHINDLHAWEAWSPWAKMDPNAKNSFEGPASGAGAAMKWEGNCKIGVGKMTITESLPHNVVRFRLDFEKPMRATNMAAFTILPESGGTVVSWSMTGKNCLMGKVMGLFMNCDKMVGGQFEKGLASLKSVAEAAGKN